LIIHNKLELNMNVFGFKSCDFWAKKSIHVTLKEFKKNLLDSSFHGLDKPINGLKEINLHRFGLSLNFNW
jgi:hypothetical protein